MTATAKVLQRNDGATLIVGVVIALAFLQFLTQVTMPVAAKIAGESSAQLYQSLPFKEQYVTPLIVLLVQLVAIELFIWLVIGARALVAPKTTKKRK